jgi:hypothetical protein
MSTAHLDSHAIATLRYIRHSMESAASIAVPGSAGIVMGSFGVAAASLSVTPGFDRHWLAVWLIAAALAASAGAVLLLRPASIRGISFRGTPVQKFVVCLGPSLIAGAVMTCVLIQANSLRLIPGVWLLMYGAGLASASVSTTRMLLLMGALFGILAAPAFLISHPLQMLVLGLGFGGLHLGFGIWMVSNGRENQI